MKKATDFCPKAFIIDFSKVLNNALLEFFRVYDSCFTKNVASDGKITFVYSGTISKSELKRIFKYFIDNELENAIKKYKQDYDNIYFKKYFVINSCHPSQNILKYNVDPDSCKYFLQENDILIDLSVLESVWNKIFDKFFKSRKTSDVVFIKHNNLNTDQIKQILILIFKGSVIDDYNVKQKCLIDINEIETFQIPADEKAKRELVIQEVKEFIIRNGNQQQ